MILARNRFVLSLVVVGIAWIASSCVDVVTVENLPAHVAFVGPTVVNDEGTVETYFGLVDFEGGTVAVDFSICPESGVCLEDLEPLAGSTTLARVPVPRRGGTAPQRVVWMPSCDPHAESVLTATVAVEGSDVAALTSPSFVLRELGACP